MSEEQTERETPEAAPAVAKKPKAKAKAAAKKATVHGDDRAIKPLVKPADNPCKPGTFCWAQVHAALNSKTVAEARKKLAADKRNPTPKRCIEIAWMVGKKFIKVT